MSGTTTRTSIRRKARSHVPPPDAVLEKKRATDRQSQKLVRDRTKKYIAHLENMVEVLQKNQQDERLQLITVQCNRLLDENERLRSTILSIKRAVQGVEQLESVNKNFTEIQNTLAGSENYNLLAYTSPSLSDGQRPAPTQPIPTLTPVPVVLSSSSVLSPSEPSDRVFSIPSSEIEGKESHIFVVISNLLREAETCIVATMDLNKDADIVIRAIAHGWTHVEQHCQLDPAWQILRRIDQEVMFCCGSVERLAILRTVRLKLLQVCFPTQEATAKIIRQLTISKRKIIASEQQVQAQLPQYMHSRPLQAAINHLSLIDYFVWPELREYLLQSPNIDLSNKTAATFASCLRFIWPFDTFDAWMWNMEMGLYSFSKLFEERLNDISSWAMSTEFFESYPHMIGYIPAHDATKDKIHG